MGLGGWRMRWRSRGWGFAELEGAEARMVPDRTFTCSSNYMSTPERHIIIVQDFESTGRHLVIPSEPQTGLVLFPNPSNLNLEQRPSEHDD